MNRINVQQARDAMQRVIDEKRRMVAVGTVIERVGTRGVSLVQPKIVFK